MIVNCKSIERIGIKRGMNSLSYRKRKFRCRNVGEREVEAGDDAKGLIE